MSKPSRPYKEELLDLTAALEDGSPAVFLLALRDVAEAHGMKRLAEGARLNRESLYRMLSDQGNPQLFSLTAVLQELGLRLAVEVSDPDDGHRTVRPFRELPDPRKHSTSPT